MIFHIDMDAFFASVEQRDHPELQGRCVIVGGDRNRGVVCAASYEARKFGVRSAMPIFQARRICPDAVYLPPRISHYRAVSRKIMDILQSFSPLVEPVSIDEAFLDAGGCRRCFGPEEEMARRLKAAIRAQLGLTCSVGGAPTKFLAKIASDMDKPDGLYLIYPDQTEALIATLPIAKVPGVGTKMGERLGRLGIETLGDVRRYGPETLARRLGKFGHWLLDLAHGIDDSPVCPHGPAKSVSSETTLSEDTRDVEVLCRQMLLQAGDVARELRKKGVRAKTISIKLKHANFKVYTRQAGLRRSTQSAERIYAMARELLFSYPLSMDVRLVGVCATNLEDASVPVQLEMFTDPQGDEGRWEKLAHTLDRIESKFGRGSVKKAHLMDHESG
jgi:DNA polymerase IV